VTSGEPEKLKYSKSWVWWEFRRLLGTLLSILRTMGVFWCLF